VLYNKIREEVHGHNEQDKEHEGEEGMLQRYEGVGCKEEKSERNRAVGLGLEIVGREDESDM
jgi:hypothetical protein